MSYLLYGYYKKYCGTYNLVFVQMKGLYHVSKIIPIVIFFATIIIGLVSKKIMVIIIGEIILIIATTILILFLNKMAKKVICKDKKFEKVKCLDGKKKYKGRWNNEEITYRLYILEKEMLYKFLERENKNTLSDILKISIDIEKLIEKVKPAFPIVPTFFGGLIVAWYSAYAKWVFDRFDFVSEILYPISLSLAIIILMFLLYVAIKMIFKTIDEIFYAQEYNRLLKFKNIVEEILIEMK